MVFAFSHNSRSCRLYLTEPFAPGSEKYLGPTPDHLHVRKVAGLNLRISATSSVFKSFSFSPMSIFFYPIL